MPLWIPETCTRRVLSGSAQSRVCDLVAVAANCCPSLTDGVVLVDALTAADAEAHWAGEDEEQARRFGWYPERSSIEQVHRRQRHDDAAH